MAIKNTQKIDRLSNTKLELGLRSGLVLEALNGKLSVNKAVNLADSVDISALSDRDLAPKVYIDGKISGLKSEVINGTLIQAGSEKRIGITTETEKLTISLLPAYTNNVINSAVDNNIVFTGQTDSKYGAFAEGQTHNMAFGPDGASGDGAVITAIHVDKYGAITKVDYKKISTSDLDNTGGVYDNYKGWLFNVGGHTYGLQGAGHTGTDVSFGTDSNGSTITTLKSLGFSGTGISVTANSEGTINFQPVFNVDDEIGLIGDGTQYIGHINQTGLADVATKNTAGLYKLTLSSTGHVKSAVNVTNEDLVALLYTLGNDSIGAGGRLVPVINTAAEGGNTVDSTKNTYFLTSEGKWAKSPINTIDLSQQSKELLLTGVSADDKKLGSIEYTSTVKVGTDGTLSATYLKGNGSNITDLNAGYINTGTLNSDRLPVIPVTKGGLGADLSSNEGLLITNNGSYTTLSANTDGTYVLDRNNGSYSFKELYDILSEYLSDNDAMVFKGTVSNANELPTTFQSGWTYKAIAVFELEDADGKIHHIEIGDMITAIKDSTATSTTGPFWVVTQANIDGAVSNVATNVAVNEIVTYDATNGLSVKGSGIIVSKSGDTISINAKAASAASADKLLNNITLWGNTFDGSGSVGGNITPDATDTYSIGSTNNKFKDIYASGTVYATTFNGTASVAEVANKTKGTLTIGDELFDGSTDVNLSIDTLGGISNVKIESDNSTGNVISGITKTSDSTSSETVFSYSRITALTKLESSLLNITANTNGNELTLSPFSSRTEGAFYKLDSTALLYGGVLKADKIQVLDGASTYRDVLYRLGLSEGSKVSGGKVLLVADYDDSSKTFGFKDSGLEYATSGDFSKSAQWSSDSTIPTAAAVEAKITSIVEPVSSLAIKSVDIVVTPTVESTSQSPTFCRTR